MMHERFRKFTWTGLTDALDFIFWAVEDIGKILKMHYTELPGQWELRIRYIKEEEDHS
jgi:hypothetical protein